MRKAIQIINDGNTIVALCDDGTIWSKTGAVWEQEPNIPSGHVVKPAPLDKDEIIELIDDGDISDEDASKLTWSLSAKEVREVEDRLRKRASKRVKVTLTNDQFLDFDGYDLQPIYGGDPYGWFAEDEDTYPTHDRYSSNHHHFTAKSGYLEYQGTTAIPVTRVLIIDAILAWAERENIKLVKEES
jgi:hypothetical protein